MKRVPMSKPRNPVATQAILRKGGAHVKTNSAKRQSAKRQLQKDLAQVKAGHAGLYSFVTPIFITPIFI